MLELIKSLILTIIVFVFIGVIIALPIFIIFKLLQSSNKNSKVSVYKKISITLLVFGLLGSIAYLSNRPSQKDRSSSYTASADGFTIENYKVSLNVSENNVVDVTEEITVDFYSYGHHGIYKFIPLWLEYTGKDEKTISRKSDIKNLVAVGEQYSLDTVSGKKRIKIGNPNQTLSTGYHNYIIKYTYNMGSDPYDNFDEFIFHAFGDFWGTRIKNASIELTMPKSFDKNNIKFFADKYRNSDITSNVYYYVVGNTLYATVSEDYNLTKSLTIDIELPENYFIGGNNNYGYVCMFICLIIVAFAIITIIKWKKNGKDLDKYSRTVEFYPPEELDASEIGYLYKKDTGKKLTVSLIVELASKGYIKIEESKDKKTQTIINMCYPDVDSAIQRKITIVKLKDYKKPKIFKTNPAQENNDDELMKTYFSNGNEYVITERFNQFYKQASNLINKGYIKVEKDTFNDYDLEYIDKLKVQLSKTIFDGKPPLTKNEKIVYDKLFREENENVLSEDTGFYAVFKEIANSVKETYDDKINDINAYKNMFMTSILFIIGTIALIMGYTTIEDLNPKYSILYNVALTSLFIIFIFTILMKRKNDYGEQITAKIKGFKDYLETAEKNQINEQAEKNPNYFYDILPYAYVLGVSKTWIKKFENIPIPQNDMGNFDYCSMDSFNTLSSSIHYPSSSSSGCSSCGGGCSSCGGGCSSCGGGGSW